MTQFSEPWTVDPNGRGIQSQIGWLKLCRGHYPDDEEPDLAVWDRIAACVNACAGMDMDDVTAAMKLLAIVREISKGVHNEMIDESRLAYTAWSLLKQAGDEVP